MLPRSRNKRRRLTRPNRVHTAGPPSPPRRAAVRPSRHCLEQPHLGALPQTPLGPLAPDPDMKTKKELHRWAQPRKSAPGFGLLRGGFAATPDRGKTDNRPIIGPATGQAPPLRPSPSPQSSKGQRRPTGPTSPQGLT